MDRSDIPELNFVWRVLTECEWVAVAKDWQVLEGYGAPNIFLSWPWIETWALTYNPAVQVLRVYEADKLVAMGLWAKQMHIRPLGLHVQTLHLHHCGVESLDQIWPEYNELLCLPAYREIVHHLLLKNIPADLGVTEVDLGVCAERLSQLLVGSELATEIQKSVSSKWPVPLSTLRRSFALPWLREERWSSVAIEVLVHQWADVDDYLASLSSSFRYQLRRAEKGLSRLGPIALRFAGSAKQCEQWLMADAHWHQAQWGEQSGFNNPEFVKFHQAWIARAFDASLCGYVRLMAGDVVVAGAYYFQDASRIYFYLGFARNEWGPKVKTGFCLHLAMIRHCFEQNIAVYDFMGGDYDYKRRFGTEGIRLVRCRYKPGSFLNRGEQLLKRGRARWKKWQHQRKQSN